MTFVCFACFKISLKFVEKQWDSSAVVCMCVVVFFISDSYCCRRIVCISARALFKRLNLSRYLTAVSIVFVRIFECAPLILLLVSSSSSSQSFVAQHSPHSFIACIYGGRESYFGKRMTLKSMLISNCST